PRRRCPSPLRRSTDRCGTSPPEPGRPGDPPRDCTSNRRVADVAAADERDVIAQAVERRAAVAEGGAAVAVQPLDARAGEYVVEAHAEVEEAGGGPARGAPGEGVAQAALLGEVAVGGRAGQGVE